MSDSNVATLTKRRQGAALQNLTTPLQKSLATEDEKLLACIHCGLCLEACPTYVATGDENDGPRGRLYLMRAVAEERLPNTSPAFSRHIDRCLGCRACEQVCPAGVEYGQLLEASRAQLLTVQTNSDASNSVLRLLLKFVWPYPARLRFLFGASRLFRDSGLANLLLKSRLVGIVSRNANFALALLVSSRRQIKSTPSSVASRKPAGKANPVLLFVGCVGEGLFARVNRATERVLTANGFSSSSPRQQVCCGALHAHGGDLEGARSLARRNVEAFAGESNVPIITNAGGCGAMLKTYRHLLESDEIYEHRAKAFSERVLDVSQLLASGAIRNGKAHVDEKVTYDASCHLMYGQHAGDSSLDMLRSISGINFVPLNGSERCCGGAGIYNLLQPELSERVLNEKLANLKDTGAGILATGNPGCQMQIGAGATIAGMNLRVCHPIELVDEAYAESGLYEEGSNGQDKT